MFYVAAFHLSAAGKPSKFFSVLFADGLIVSSAARNAESTA